MLDIAAAQRRQAARHARFATSADYPVTRDAEGRRCCRWCRTPLAPPRRSWCSDACVDAYLLVSDPSRVRRALLERDGGVCALCGLDCEAAWGRIVEASKTARCAFSVERELRRWLGIPGHRVTLWDADHITPVVLGGGKCGLENYRTLCLWCHQRVTAELATTRAQQRAAAAEGVQGR